MTATVWDVFPGTKLDPRRKYFFGLISNGERNGIKGKVLRRNQQGFYLIELDEPKKRKGARNA